MITTSPDRYELLAMLFSTNGLLQRLLLSYSYIKARTLRANLLRTTFETPQREASDASNLCVIDYIIILSCQLFGIN